ncbi:unnamed protein product [Adineta ricciae]|uniref:Uncharacterized protein n=1 Tax=Adineta ricciae TaxID=249248 RepID=A0A815TI72_ADIRI|nr:unnamed protein product [Adineta ricciae]
MTSSATNTVKNEKFVQIYTPDEKTVQLLDNGRTFKNLKFGICACALGDHFYSFGIHCIRIRVDEGHPVLGIRSRNIPPIADEDCSGSYDASPSTYGWKKDVGRILNGSLERSGRMKKVKDIKIGGPAYTMTVNCDDHQLSILDENNKEEDVIDLDVNYIPFPWCLFIALPRATAQVALM